MSNQSKPKASEPADEKPHPRTVVHPGASHEYTALAYVCVPGMREWQAVAIRVVGEKVVQRVPLGECEPIPFCLSRIQSAASDMGARAQAQAFPPHAIDMMPSLPERLP